MSNNKQSSVEYLIEHLLPKALTVEQYYHIEKAKAMHKEENKTSFIHGLIGDTLDEFNKYYNETFEQ
jgi:hypothetical protein